MPAGGEAAAVDFYEGLLGLAQVPKPDVLAGRGGCWFERGEVRIHLGVEAPFAPARKAHPALIVTGLRALVAELAEAGVTVTEADPLDGVDRVHVADPFGNRIELVEPRAEDR
jgi:catechol 2,3-dioxygenase-like lactoylglutathione lyase family enzyme